MTQKLTVALVARRLVSELEKVGFAVVKSRTLKLVKILNEDTEVFLHPGVMRSGNSVRVDPVIGVDNVTLRQRLVAQDRHWKGSARVCHAYLGMLDSWGRFYLRNNRDLDHAAAQIVKSVIEIGLPTMSKYDTRDKVRRLFRDDLAHTKCDRVAVLFAKEKLEQIEEH